MKKHPFPDIGQEVVIVSGHAWGKVAAYASPRDPSSEFSDVVVRLYFGAERTESVENLAAHIEPPLRAGMRGLWDRLWCRCGLHRFEKNPLRKDIVRRFGEDFAFWTDSVQCALARCERPGCHAERLVYRRGWCGPGTKNTRWRKMPRGIAERIASLPNVFA